MAASVGDDLKALVAKTTVAELLKSARAGKDTKLVVLSKVRTRLNALLNVRFGPVPRQRDPPQPIPCGSELHQIVTRAVRQPDVRDQQIDLVLLQQARGPFYAGGYFHPVTRRPQQHLHHLRRIRVILNQ